jgi:hypothetical protein
MPIIKARYNPGMNPFAARIPCRFDGDSNLGDAGVVYEFNVKIYRLASNASEGAWYREVESARERFHEEVANRWPGLDVTGFTGRSAGWLCVEDTTGQMTEKRLAALERMVTKALERFKRHMVAKYPRHEPLVALAHETLR